LVTLLTPYLLFFVLGAEPTIAQCIRNFVTEHSDYKQDSVVSETINYDLLKLIQEKTEKCETLSTATNFNSKTKHDIPLALSKAENYLNEKSPQNMTNGINTS